MPETLAYGQTAAYNVGVNISSLGTAYLLCQFPDVDDVGRLLGSPERLALRIKELPLLLTVRLVGGLAMRACA